MSSQQSKRQVMRGWRERLEEEEGGSSDADGGGGGGGGGRGQER